MDGTTGTAPGGTNGDGVPQMMSVKAVAARLALSPRQIWKLTACGRFPKPLKIGRATRWREKDILAFLSEQAG